MVSVGKEHRQTLFSVEYVKKKGFTSNVVVCVVSCRGQLTVSGVGDVMGQSRKLIYIAEDLMVDGEMYECVKRFGYL